MNFDWRQNGFLYPPTLVDATGTEKIYRAWGGDPQRKWGNKNLPGVCFSLDRASSRCQAERFYSVMEYQNPVRFLTEFSVKKGTPLWVGKVDPGDRRALLGANSGNQILIERAHLDQVKEVATSLLTDDLKGKVVHTGKLPRVYS